MKLHDPRRPRIGNDLPAFIDMPNIAIAWLYVYPTADGKISLATFLPSTYGGSSWKHREIEANTLQIVFANFADDPEATFKQLFGWEYDPRMGLRQKPAAALGRTKDVDLSALDSDAKASQPDLSALD